MKHSLLYDFDDEASEDLFLSNMSSMDLEEYDKYLEEIAQKDLDELEEELNRLALQREAV